MARPRNPTLKRPRRPWTTARTTTVLRQWGPRHCELATSVLRNCCFNCCAKHSHKDSVRSTAVEEHLKRKTSPLSEPSSTSLLLISSGLSWESSSTSLLLISPGLCFTEGADSVKLVGDDFSRQMRGGKSRVPHELCN